VAVRLPHVPEQADIAALRQIREALDLLARVAIVDNAAWRALLVHQCRVPRDEDDPPLDCDLHPRFRFVFNENFVVDGAVPPAVACKQFFVATNSIRESDDYLEARRVLATMEASDAFKAAKTTSIPFELQFELVTLPEETLETHLRDINSMLAILQGCRSNIEVLLPLELDSIRLDVGGVNMTWSLTQRLTSLLSSGLPISLLAFSLKKATAQNHGQMKENVGRFLRAVLCGQERGHLGGGDAERGGVKTLSVGCHDCDEWQFAALCSALGFASVTQHLRLYGVFRMSDTAEVRKWKWQWLAYALFRTTTRSTVARALITAAQLTRDDTLAIAVAIHSNSPPTVALNAMARSENLLNVSRWRRDTIGYFLEGTELVLVNPAQEEHDEDEDAVASTSAFLEADEWLHIVSDGDDHLDVVLPGFGIARIDKLSAGKVEQRQQERQDSAACGLNALTLALGLHVGDDGSEVLADFLNLVGSRLRSLALYAVGSYPISMATICRACPQLTDLFLEGLKLSNPEEFYIDAERTQCQLSCLGLVNVFSTSEQISRLAAAIAEPTTHLAQHLCELGLSGCIDDASVQAFLSMLKSNQKLSYLSLGMDPELQAAYDEAFMLHHGEALPVVEDKLSTQCKSAFLSAARGEKLSDSAISALDDGVLSLVVEFAATCKTRAVAIHYDD
jgi:hypothetical protein